MARDNKAQQQRLLQRNKEIRDMYEEWRAKRKDGVRIYTDEYIYAQIEKRYFISKNSIADVLQLRYERELEQKAEAAKGDPSQLSILDQIGDDTTI